MADDNKNGEMSWDEFVKCAEELVSISNGIADGWEIVINGENAVAVDPSTTYLSKKCIVNVPFSKTSSENDAFGTVDDGFIDPSVKIVPQFDTLSFQYHVVYSLAYAVPVLYFNAHKSNGTLIRVEDAWDIFDEHYKTIDMQSTLTQMEHPILFRPFLTLHPCRTNEFLSIMKKSKNKIITFLSTIGPAIHLKMDLIYGK